MRKSSVYLPDNLKSRLSALAERTGVSEAELIREAIEARLAASGPEPSANGSGGDGRRVGPSVAGRLVGVGVGPGPADLVTTRALDALRRADRVVAPCTSLEAIGRAEAIVREAAPDVVVERMVFVMRPDHDARAAALIDVCDRIAAYLEAGDEVAFITLGDPNTYSTVSSVVAGVLARRPHTTVETVAGIMAFQALAMAGDVVLTDEQQTLVLLPASAPPEQLDAELARGDRTVILYKGGGRIGAVAEQLEAADRLDGAVMGELIGMPGQRIARVADVRDRPASYLSAVISPAPEGIGPTPPPSTAEAAGGASGADS
ncbi:MAG: precorrin-2 C(20)-methyltransferase [Actinomycetota bacterium]